MALLQNVSTERFNAVHVLLLRDVKHNHGGLGAAVVPEPEKHNHAKRGRNPDGRVFGIQDGREVVPSYNALPKNMSETLKKIKSTKDIAH